MSDEKNDMAGELCCTERGAEAEGAVCHPERSSEAAEPRDLTAAGAGSFDSGRFAASAQDDDASTLPFAASAQDD